MRTFFTLCATVFFAISAIAQTSANPNVTEWLLNTTGDTYNGSLTDIAEVWYTTDSVYIKANGIPSYYSTLTHSSVFDPSAQNYIMRFAHSPAAATMNRDNTSGFCGLWLNGTYVATPGDGQYYDPNSTGLTEWSRLAWYFEGINFAGPNPTGSPWGDFDETFGHSTANNQYHYHVLNNAMMNDYTDSSGHSPIIGFAYDGFPIYGPFGYDSPMNSGSGITRMKSGFSIRNISNRNTLPNGNTSTNPPPINSTYPLGCFTEDYEYTGNGHLDEHNGRTCVTPEYPSGTYAYFVTLNDTLGPAYPYNLGTSFYGRANYMGASPSVTSIPASAVQYTGNATSIQDWIDGTSLQVFPNPASDWVAIRLEGIMADFVQIVNLNGALVMEKAIRSSGEMVDISALPAGYYIVIASDSEKGPVARQRLIKQ